MMRTALGGMCLGLVGLSAAASLLLVGACSSEQDPEPAAPTESTAPPAASSEKSVEAPADVPARPETVRTERLTEPAGDGKIDPRVAACSGEVLIRRGNATGAAAAQDRLVRGDELDVREKGGRADVTFLDGCKFTLVGPARLRFTEIGAQGRRVRLLAGVLDRIYVRGIALDVQTPAKASLVLQNADGTAEVRADGGVEFRNVKGNYAKVYHRGRAQDVIDGRWSTD